VSWQNHSVPLAITECAIAIEGKYPFVDQYKGTPSESIHSVTHTCYYYKRLLHFKKFTNVLTLICCIHTFVWAQGKSIQISLETLHIHLKGNIVVCIISQG